MPADWRDRTTVRVEHFPNGSLVTVDGPDLPHPAMDVSFDTRGKLLRVRMDW